MENLYKEGDKVCTKVNPKRPLVVRIYARRIYYCGVYNHPEKKEEVYFEREIMPYKEVQESLKPLFKK